MSWGQKLFMVAGTKLFIHGGGGAEGVVAVVIRMTVEMRVVGMLLQEWVIEVAVEVRMRERIWRHV